MGDQKKDKQNPGLTDEEQKRENERAGQNPYDKDQTSNPGGGSGRKSKTCSLIRATFKTIPIERPLARVSGCTPLDN